ncbi:putative lipoprotein [Labilithrix luteola]|uniref:Putative lipoprotein n=1 Tax=Labilithrix luteola TaxID=1391654 RepID=A0A0K1Q0R6_9BACT|nr:MopE-related protein [Labilithrix luteola]AKU99378.1 putative lipoprotein [Labilithrix luteola]
MQRIGSKILVLGALSALYAVACAQGSDDGQVASSTDTVFGDGGGPTADGGCTVLCGALEVCSGGKCVSKSADEDHDGYPAAIDCNDKDPTIHPGATEVCNGKDDDCNGKVDDPFDIDGDGFPTCAVDGKAPDCDDRDPDVHPGATEVCNGKDDNCNGKIDEGFDADNDGYYVCVRGTLSADCDDTDPAVHPGATEVCNGKDDDCNGKVDDLPATLSGSLTTPVNPHWVLAGNASFSNGWAQLNQDVKEQTGGLFWNAAYSFDTFEVNATFWIQAKADGADGMAFAWLAGSNMSALGGGPVYGVGGLTGYAVAIDTYQNPGEPAVPYLLVFDATHSVPLATTSIPNVRDGQNHLLKVRLEAGKVSVWVDAINRISAFALPGYMPFTGHWGFTAGTGGASETHWVRDITMSFPDGQGCVP